MAILLQIDFPFAGPFGDEMTKTMTDLAQSIANEPGLLWKIWTVNEQTREAGGIYLFENELTAETYSEKHSERLRAAGIKNIRIKLFTVDKELSALSKTPPNLLR